MSEIDRLTALGSVGAVLDELQHHRTEWDDAREALDALIFSECAAVRERDEARAEVEQWRATFGETALRDGLARMARAEAERDRLAEQADGTEGRVRAAFTTADERGVMLDALTVDELTRIVMTAVRGEQDGEGTCG
ncbi:hypothetical protein GCM10010182_67240 [Actinomadura cremea]|nr:hypothetical protein GCM10010182_67240 [Actinomadura cremea]